MAGVESSWVVRRKEPVSPESCDHVPGDDARHLRERRRHDERRIMRGIGLGVAIGAGVGAVMASAYGSEYLAIGIAAGLAIGGGLEATSRRNNDNDEDGET